MRAGWRWGSTRRTSLTGQFYLSAAGYSGAEQREFCRRLRQRMEQVPGVVAAGYSDVVPLNFGRSPWHQVSIEGYAPTPGENMNLHRSLVSPGYFDLMKIRLLEGRDFSDADHAKAAPVLIVNEMFVRRYLGSGVAIGRRVQLERGVDDRGWRGEGRGITVRRRARCRSSTVPSASSSLQGSTSRSS
jgi:hypothetical protein